MTNRHEITGKAETVLTMLSTTPKGDTKIWMSTFGMTDNPESVRGTRRILASLVKIGYANVERLNGRDYWTATPSGERHWPTVEEMEETSRALRALIEKRNRVFGKAA